MRKVLLLILLGSVIMQAQNLSNAMWSFSLDTPENWKYQDNGGVILLGHDTIAGLIIVYPHTFSTKHELKNVMQQGLNEEGGYLQIQGVLDNFDKDGYQGNYVGIYQMQTVKAKAYGRVVAQNGGATIIVMTTPESFSKELDKAGKFIANSLKKKKQNSTQGHIDITQRFIGKWSYYSKYSESHVYLYPDGTYSDNSTSGYGNSNASVGATWGVANDTQNRGRWQARGNANNGQIIFTQPNGEKSAYPYQVHIKNGHTYWSEYYFGNKLYSRKPLQ